MSRLAASPATGTTEEECKALAAMSPERCSLAGRRTEAVADVMEVSCGDGILGCAV